MDLAGSTPAATHFVSRLRSFGYDSITVCIENFRPAWASEKDVAEARSKAEAWARGENLSFFHHDLREDDPREYGASMHANLSGGEDGLFLDLSLRSLFVPREELAALEAPLADAAVLACFRIPAWEGMWLARKSYYSESAKREVYGTKSASILPPATECPLKFPEWDLRLAFLPVVERLSKTAPPEEWSYDHLVKLRQAEPSLFRPYCSHVGVELTNEDNLPRLRHPSKISKRPTGFLSDDSWQALLESLPVDMTPFSLDFWDFGEPLLHPRAIDFVEQAARKGARVDLYTNGILLDAEKAARLASSGLDALFFRLDAATPETHARVGGKAGDFERATKNLAAFLAAKKSRCAGQAPPWSPQVAVQITEMPETAADIDAFFDRYDLRTAAENRLREKHGRLPMEHEVLAEVLSGPEPIEHAMLRHDNLFRGRVSRPDSEMCPLFRFPCRQLLEGPHVLWNGDIVPCREDVDGEHVVGHVRDGLTAAWRGARMASVLQVHDTGSWDASAFCGPCKEWYYPFS